MRAGEKQRAELTAQFDAERLRRWRLIEEKGDVEVSIRELFGVSVAGEGEGDQEIAALELHMDGLADEPYCTELCFSVRLCLCVRVFVCIQVWLSS